MINDSLLFSRNRLPHWNQAGSAYFVTWCLSQKLTGLTPEEKSLIAKSLKHFNGERYKLQAFVVMDDHIHVLVQPLSEFTLSSILHSWKSFTANRINRIRRRSGSLWQKDTHQRILRDERELQAKLEYIMNNPIRRWPGINEYEWLEWFTSE